MASILWPKRCGRNCTRMSLARRASSRREEVMSTAAASVEFEVGERLRALREAFGLSQRALAPRERLEPGADTGVDMLRHESEESGVVVRGKLELTVGGQTYVLGAGDAYYFDSRLPHRFRNVGSGVCEVVSACTPPSF